jgi:tetratricopeptide (TPR) repeat protein
MPIWYRTLVRWGVLFVAVFGVWMTVRWLAGDVLLVQARKVLAKKDLPSTKRAIRMLAQAEVLLGKQAAFDRGIAFRGAAAWVRAARSFEEAFALRPSPEAALSVSGAWFALGRTQRALYWAQLAVYLHPRYARGFHQLGIIYLEKRRMYDAWRCLRRARSLRPGDPRIRHAWRRLPWSWRQR